MPKSKKKNGSSSTPGKSKGENCHRSQIKNLYAKDARFYRTNPEAYAAACRIVDEFKGNRILNK